MDDEWTGAVDMQSGVSRAPCGLSLALVNKVLWVSVTPTHLRCDSSGAAAAVTDVRPVEAHLLAPWHFTDSLPTCSAGDPGLRGRTAGHGRRGSHGASMGLAGCVSSPGGVSMDQGRVQGTAGLQGPLDRSGGGGASGRWACALWPWHRRSSGGSC